MSLNIFYIFIGLFIGLLFLYCTNSESKLIIKEKYSN